MLKKVLKRILISIPVLVGVVLLIFIMLRIVPGDPVTTMMGEHVNPAVIEKISKEMGLDKPLYVQFFQYITHALRGDFGTSYRLNRNVTKIILEAFPNTVKLSLLAAVVAWIIGIVAGIIHYCLVTSVPAIHGGFNLYNGGFTAGLVCFVMIPVMEHFFKTKEERKGIKA